MPSGMFMDKNDWSDDDLEDMGDIPIVPMDLPTPQVLSGNGAINRPDGYNERLARARNHLSTQRRSSSGAIMMNEDRPMTGGSTPRGGLTLQAPPIDVLSQEVEEMELRGGGDGLTTQSQLQRQQQQQERSAPPQSRNDYYRDERDDEPYQASYARAPPSRAVDAASSSSRQAPGFQVATAAVPQASYGREQQQQQAAFDISDDAPYASHSSQPYASASHNQHSPQELPPPHGGPPTGQPIVSVPRPMENQTPAVIDTSDLEAFLLRPGPQGAMVQCYIQRRKSGLANPMRLYPTYEVYLKDGEQFLLSARRRKKQKQSNYKVSRHRDDLSRHSHYYFGKLKSNFMGTEFQMYDKGANPGKLTPDQRDGSNIQVRQELATVLYKQNVLGSRGPRKMKVLVPMVDEQGNREVLRPTSLEDTMLEKYKEGKPDDNVLVLKNKHPKWNDSVGAYVLNFNGRVTRASVKNFQLCIASPPSAARDPELVVMQFGRVGKDAFTMDYQWPLCGLQAFGIALSSFDYKIACE